MLGISGHNMLQKLRSMAARFGSLTVTELNQAVVDIDLIMLMPQDLQLEFRRAMIDCGLADYGLYVDIVLRDELEPDEVELIKQMVKKRYPRMQVVNVHHDEGDEKDPVQVTATWWGIVDEPRLAYPLLAPIRAMV